MRRQKQAFTDRLWLRMLRVYKDNKIPFIAAFIAGMLAHGFAFANKLVNHDEIESLFGKGATITSGRWGLELVKILFPDWSMPWIYGIVSVLLISIAVCMIIRLLDIRSKPMQVILAALMLSFPSLTGTFCFMFTSSAYALAFLLSVGAVYIYQRGAKFRLVKAGLLLVLGLSMYQAYISIAACLFILLMIEDALEEDSDVWQIVLYGLKAVLFMAAAVAVYYAISLLVLRCTGAQFNDYVMENVNGSLGIFGRLRMAYDSFLYTFTFRNFYLISTEACRYIHIALAELMLLSLGALCYRNKKLLHALLLLCLLGLLPLAIECMYLIMSGESIHTLVIYSFTAVYMLCAILIDRLSAKAAGRWVKDALVMMLVVISVSNIYFANMTYLKMHLQYENAAAFYTSLIAQVKSTEGFDEDSKLAIIGRQDNLMPGYDELDTSLLMGPARDLVNIYSRENFFRYYLGFSIPFAGDEELAKLSEDGRVQAMAEYPYYGSVQKLDDYIVVKLG